MRTTAAESKIPTPTHAKVLRLPDERQLTWVALGLILALAGGLRFAYLGELGYANHYYAAAIRSMLQSWHNFFFLAAEPGGMVSVDKSPLGLWLQALSAFIFGVNGFGLLLPEILSGLLSVVLVFHLVRRWFGSGAGLVSALALAVTPVVVAVDRNNTIDSPLILTLLLSAWAFMKATETGQLRHLLLGALLVGLAFNIKMLAAFLPLPAFYALYLLGAKAGIWSKLARLALASLALLAVSLAWVTVVQLTPPSQRPYVGSSGDNSEYSLIVGYNGLNRLLGMRVNLPHFIQNLIAGNPAGNPTGNPTGNLAGNSVGNPAGSQAGPGFPTPAGSGFPGNPRNFRGGFAGGFGGGFGGGFRGNFRGNFGGFFQGGLRGGGMLSALNTGRPGLLRLLQSPLNKEVGWLLPFGLISLLLAALSTRLTWPLALPHQGLILWGGWLLAGMVFFNIASFYHPYYLSILGAPVAALVGIGMASLWRLGKRSPWLAIVLLVFSAATTLVFQAYTALSFVQPASWLLEGLALFTLGAGMLLSTANLPSRKGLGTGFALVMASLMLAPTVWSGLTARYPSDNQSLPAAYDGYFKGPARHGGLQVNQDLIDFLQANTQGVEYLLAVPSSMQGSDYVLATGRPVLYMGGFDGNDRILTSQELAQLVASGRLRYIYWNTNGSESVNLRDIDQWVAAQCQLVPGFDTITVNAGAPGGTSNNASAAPGFGRGFQITLYDCGG
jgi:4-amino-4-deoxy-L-arabinose transferase-like glycosyltransferase